ncbi:tRNA pseudouridine(55) synthase TruB [Emcibacter nanhaiensis]|uniref:tRNA pseudouridine synthase B n=1 Tax=Emcibacter nanhaiensis TaxID=1505037 RepID=A0A501PNY3_9PROT|nr:tRNA pseudouridine(55) synthase TruB [Emcibacter nanhaiensis]TPD61481.1 tRNA pseudouridine(55) synthase TruB [Emcibacter nanhaiensis]
MGRKRKGLKIDGWLVIDKPLGMTSTQAVGRVRRLTNAAKIGHGGTLDPLASGILPIALGEATKTIPFVMDARKTYRFTVTWGEERSTDDAEGEIVARSDHRPTAAEIVAVLPQFTGTILQRPPAFSAIKVDGKRAYDLARAGEEVELKEREITIFSLRLEAFEEGAATFEVECGKGTYIRSLARDLAHALGTVGYVSMLRRTKVGCFGESVSISLDNQDDLVHSAPLEDRILPVETVLDDILALAVTEEEAKRLQQGQKLTVPNCTTGLVRVTCNGKFIALAECAENILKPVRVFNL